MVIGRIQGHGEGIVGEEVYLSIPPHNLRMPILPFYGLLNSLSRSLRWYNNRSRVRGVLRYRIVVAERCTLYTRLLVGRIPSKEFGYVFAYLTRTVTYALEMSPIPALERGAIPIKEDNAPSDGRVSVTGEGKSGRNVIFDDFEKLVIGLRGKAQAKRLFVHWVY